MARSCCGLGRLALIVCLVALAAGPALARMTVEIVMPDTDPCQAQAGAEVGFGAIAYVDGEETPPGLVRFEWDFGDTGTSDENPTGHAYAEAGTYICTVVAYWGEERAEDTVTVQVGK